MDNLSSDVQRPRLSVLPVLTAGVLSNIALKRCFDILVALIALSVLAPLFVVLIRLIKRDGGAAFYAQRRVGLNGKEFRCFKFRTMVPNAEQHLNLILASDPALRLSYETYWKLVDDPRITPIGHALRRYSLDELPQLINVLCGDMSIVGPRPRSSSEALYMDQTFSLSALYTMVRPGITGLWQVSGRNALTLAEKAVLDATYVKSWTLGGDIMLMLRTVGVVLSGRGAH